MRPVILGTIENWNAGAAHSGKQPLGRFDRAMSIDAATVRILRIEVDRSARTASIDKIVEIDCQERPKVRQKFRVRMASTASYRRK